MLACPMLPVAALRFRNAWHPDLSPRRRTSADLSRSPLGGLFALLLSAKSQPACFQSAVHSFAKNTRVGASWMDSIVSDRPMLNARKVSSLRMIDLQKPFPVTGFRMTLMQTPRGVRGSVILINRSQGRYSGARRRKSLTDTHIKDRSGTTGSNSLGGRLT